MVLSGSQSFFCFKDRTVVLIIILTIEELKILSFFFYTITEESLATPHLHYPIAYRMFLIKCGHINTIAV